MPTGGEKKIQQKSGLRVKLAACATVRVYVVRNYFFCCLPLKHVLRW